MEVLHTTLYKRHLQTSLIIRHISLISCASGCYRLLTPKCVLLMADMTLYKHVCQYQIQPLACCCCCYHHPTGKNKPHFLSRHTGPRWKEVTLSDFVGLSFVIYTYTAVYDNLCNRTYVYLYLYTQMFSRPSCPFLKIYGTGDWRFSYFFFLYMYEKNRILPP